VSRGAPGSAFPRDVNEDGRPDIVFSSQTGASVGVLFNRAEPGGLAAGAAAFVPVALPAVGLPSQGDLGDLNGDGFVDIVFPDFSGSNVLVYLNRFDPTAPERFDPTNPGNELDRLFAPPLLVPAGRSIFAVIVLDVNDDGKQDLLAVSNGSNTINIFFQR
jgi:hypothetical protein